MHHRPLRAAATVIAGAAVLTGLAVGPAVAAPQTATVDMDGIDAAGSTDTLANEVTFVVDSAGQWNGVYRHQNNNTTTTWTFSRPVDVYFSIDGLNGSAGLENVELPAGTQVVELHPGHAWNAVTHVVAGNGGACSQNCPSTFLLEDTLELTTRTFGSGTWSRGIGFIEVTTDLPESSIGHPVEGGTYTVGGGDLLDLGCTGGEGGVDATATLNGAPIQAGDPIDSAGPGTHTIEVTCNDGYGASHSSSVTFDVVAAPEPPAPACPEDGLQVLEPPVSDIALGESPNRYIHLDGNGTASGTVHDLVEPLLDQVVDPLTVPLLGLDTDPVVHQLNCDVVEPIEDLVDQITIPVVEQVKTVVKNVLKGLRLW